LDTIHIDWGKGVIRFSDVENFKSSRLDGKGFYALLGAVYNPKTEEWGAIKLLYIGQAFEQTLRTRIRQEHPAYECVFDYKKKHSSSKVDIVVMLGVVQSSTVKKLTQQLFNDIECCLVHKNKPLCNTSCKELYSGRDLKIINVGSFYPLTKEHECSETE